MLSDPFPDILTAARHYRDRLGWIVHPLHGPNEGTEKERGKKPRLTGWKKLTVQDCDDAFLQKHFSGPAPANLGVVVKPPHIVIDLDSKKDEGASVHNWLIDTPEVAHWPRERTAGGCHLHIQCQDVPDEVIEAAGRNQKLTSTLGEGVTAEIFLGGNIVLAPSVHKSGHRYVWDVTGDPPIVPWAQLEAVFFSNQPVSPEKPKKGTRQRKEPPWWARYKGDLKSLDIVALTQHLGIYGQPLGGEEGKHTVRCPWHDLHSDAKDRWNCGDSSSVIWQGKPPSLPSFFCSHTSHGEKSLADFLAWAESREKGIVDRLCRQQRIWEPGQLGSKNRPRILLPNLDRPESQFAAEIGHALRHKEHLFNRSGLVTEVRKVAGEGMLFVPLKAAAAVTSVETHVEVGTLVKTPGEDGSDEFTFAAKSMSQSQAAVLLEAEQLRSRLPELERMFHVPMPILMADGSIEIPKPGYDPRFKSWLAHDAPKLKRMSMAEAKGWIHELLKEFCFRDKQALIHAIAATITPFCRGLYPRWTCRVPVFAYEANRPRSGKDYLAGNNAIIHEGRDIEDAPIPPDSQELRKKITATLMSGRRRVHFANCKGFLNSDVLENITTSEQWADRLLGYNQEVTLGNELEFSLSANIGLTYTPDFANRIRKVFLAFFEEDANKRRFERTDLKSWTRKHRSELLSALMTFVMEWQAKGRPSDAEVFTSYPAWSEVVGGIMVACGLGDPCLADVGEDSDISGDTETRDMKALFFAGYERYPEVWIRRDEIFDLVRDAEDCEWFHWLDLDTKSGKTRFGMILGKFVTRELGGITLKRDTSDSNTKRRKFQFTKSNRPTIFDPQELFQGLKMNPARVDKVDIPKEIAPKNTSTLSTLSTFLQPADHGKKQKSRNTHTCVSVEEEKKHVHVCARPCVEEGERVDKVDRVDIPDSWQLVTDLGEFDDIAEEIALADHPLALDLETYGRDALNPRRSDIRFLVLGLPWRAPWLIDLQATGYELGGLGGVIESCELVIHNARFDLGFLAHHLGLHPQQVFCTLTASRLLSAGTRQSNALGEVLRRYDIADLSKEYGSSDWGAMLLTDEQLAYAAADVAHLHALRGRLEQELEKADLMEVWALEAALIPIVVRMEANGFMVDRVALERIREKGRLEAKALGDQVQECLGATFNPGSPEQLRTAFQNAGVQITSTAEATLAELDHPASKLVLSMRSAEKAAQQAQSLLEAVDGDGRIHGQFDATGTEAGRFSSRSPNLQNIGRGPLRECFIAPEGRALVCADYSQIELRVAAALAGETRMIEAYESGADLHRRTAALVLGKSEEEVTKDDRQVAKACFSGDTEILTEAGWVRFDHYDGQTPVAQYSLPEGVVWNPPRPRSNRWGYPSGKVRWDWTGKIEFVAPMAFRSFPRQQLWHHKDRNTDLLLTDNHEVAFVTNAGNPTKIPASDVTPGNCRSLIAAGILERKDVQDELKTRFLAMYVADGSASSGRAVRFGFTKQRKIDRCADLCDAMAVNYRMGVNKQGVTQILVTDCELVAWLNKWISKGKSLSWNCLLGLDAEVYLDEARHWDASQYFASHWSSRNRVIFSTTVKQTADVMQAMAATAGINSTLSVACAGSGAHSTCYRLSYRLGGAPLFRASWRLQKTDLIDDVYCVQVPSGAILIRRNGKVCVQGNCNFGLLYGQSAPGLVKYAKTSYGVDMTVGEAERIRDRFFRTYRGLAEWHGRTRELANASDLQETRTRLGRRRLMPQGQEQFWQRFSGGLNTPVQGGAADGLKKALILLASRLPAEAAILSTVHDEIIIECPADQADAVSRTMEEAMREAMAGLYPEIPIEVEAHTGTTWAAAK